eukprot:m.38260 g.38260  ORF g.38260 m.38260 type:complete len:353 (+) comp5492_c0_seq3:83-1141(+)
MLTSNDGVCMNNVDRRPSMHGDHRAVRSKFEPLGRSKILVNRLALVGPLALDGSLEKTGRDKCSGWGGTRSVAEVLVLEGLLGGEPGRGVARKQSRDEINAIRANRCQVLREGRGNGALELDVVRQARDTWPVALVDRAKGAENLGQLVQIGCARKVRRAHLQLGLDAADRPHVDRGAVAPRAEEQLGAAVPDCHGLAGQAAVRAAKLGCEAKVSNLQNAACIEHEVAGLEVPVHYPAIVQVLQALQQHDQEALDIARRQKTLAVLDDFLEICGAELQHEAHICAACIHIVQLENVVVVELLQELYLSQCCAIEAFLCLFDPTELDLLHCKHLLAVPVLDLIHNTELALTEL